MRTVKKNAGCTVGGRGDLAEEGLQKAPFFFGGPLEVRQICRMMGASPSVCSEIDHIARTRGKFICPELTTFLLSPAPARSFCREYFAANRGRIP
jgi:hypothetical protein